MREQKQTSELSAKDFEMKGYTVCNVKITSADIIMCEHGVADMRVVLEDTGWGCCYGGYVLGHGYVGADDNFFDGSAAGMESILRIMDIAGAESLFRRV